MQYGLVDGQRSLPQPKTTGRCPICSEPLVAKCGSKIIWHWSHKSKLHCDPWWENETEWHRQWKACFPEPWREHIHFDDTGEKHIADVKTGDGLVLEFQNSQMDPDELASREAFYGKMIWIVNGIPFADRFYVLGRLPNPKASMLSDVVFFQQRFNKYGRLFWRRSENPSTDGTPLSMVEVHSVAEIQHDIDQNYIGHHFFDWVRPKDVWLSAKSPVFFDFGGDILWNLQRFRTTDILCVQAIRKSSIVHLWNGSYVTTGQVVTLPSRSPAIGRLNDKCDTALLIDALS